MRRGREERWGMEDRFNRWPRTRKGARLCGFHRCSNTRGLNMRLLGMFHAGRYGGNMKSLVRTFAEYEEPTCRCEVFLVF